jgi:FAD/FMN-containing dehydrogenase
VNLRILPHPPAENSLLLSFAERSQAFALLAELAMTHLTPTALEYLDHTAMHTLTQDDSHCGVLLRIEGTDTACQRHVQDIQALANKHNATATRLFTAEEHAPVWQQVNDLLAPQQLEQDDIMLRLVVLPAQTEEAIAHMEALAGNHALSLRSQARAWHGVIYARVGGTAESIHQFCASLTERWHHCHVLACDPQQHASLPRWGKPDPNSDLMAAIKQAFDPAHTLNRGRMDGCFDGVETDEREPATVQTHEEAEPVGV